MTLFNVGLGFVAFGAMLLIPAKMFDAAVRKRHLIAAKIVGYKQFPSDRLITNNDISIGPNFDWLRVVEFPHPQTGEPLQMFSNPAVREPEPIGTTLMVALDPAKTDPQKNHVLVRGGESTWRSVGKISLVTGTALYLVLLFVPASSPLQPLGAFGGFAVFFALAVRKTSRKGNQ